METNVFQNLEYDSSIHKKSRRPYYPFDATKIDKSDVVRIEIKDQNAITLPSESVLYIQGTITNESGAVLQHSKITNNFAAFLFSEIRYYINDQQVDVSRNTGMTTLIKNYLSFNDNDVKKYENAGWFPIEGTCNIINETHFDCTIPLKSWLGIFEDFKKILIHANQELVLTRSRLDENCFIVDLDASKKEAKEKPKITLTQIVWKMPHITLSDEIMSPLLKKVNDGSSAIIPYRSWELHERPDMPKSSPITWRIRTTTVEKPRYIIIGFSTNRVNTYKHDCTKFDNCNVRDVRLYLNSEYWPFEKIPLDFKKGYISELYEMYAEFQTSYYAKDPEPMISRNLFNKFTPMHVIDCSLQNDELKLGGVDVRIEIEASENIPENTTCYCLIIHDKIVTYTPLTNAVQMSL